MLVMTMKIMITLLISCIYIAVCILTHPLEYKFLESRDYVFFLGKYFQCN